MHVGKPFPNVARPRIYDQAAPWRVHPPRKLALKMTSYAAPGAKAAPWFNLRVLSSVVEMVSSSSDQFFYEWICPTDATNVIRGVYSFENKPYPFFPFTIYTWDNVYTHYIGGVAWGHASAATTTNGAFPYGGYGGFLTLPGPTPAQPTQWISADFQFEVASWAEQPEYHPYRYEP